MKKIIYLSFVCIVFMSFYLILNKKNYEYVKAHKINLQDKTEDIPIKQVIQRSIKTPSTYVVDRKIAQVKNKKTKLMQKALSKRSFNSQLPLAPDKLELRGDDNESIVDNFTPVLKSQFDGVMDYPQLGSFYLVNNAFSKKQVNQDYTLVFNQQDERFIIFTNTYKIKYYDFVVFENYLLKIQKLYGYDSFDVINHFEHLNRIHLKVNPRSDFEKLEILLNSYQAQGIIESVEREKIESFQSAL